MTDNTIPEHELDAESESAPELDGDMAGGRRLQILRAVGYCWYREQPCYWAKLKRMLPDHCGDSIWRDVQQLLYDGFLTKDEKVISQGRI